MQNNIQSTPKVHKVSSAFVYFFGALGGLLFGYDTGVISGAILFIEKQLHLDSWQQGWVVSAVLLGAILGSAVIGPMSDRYGRRKLVLLSGIIFFIGAIGSAFSPEFWTLIVSRIILGMAVGAASALIPTYLAELSPADKRGSMSSLFQLMVMTGIFILYRLCDQLFLLRLLHRLALDARICGHSSCPIVLRGVGSARKSPLLGQRK